MNLKRFFLGSLLSVCLVWSGASSVYASLASNSDAFKVRASNSNAFRMFNTPMLRAASGVTAVTNTVDRTGCYIALYPSATGSTNDRVPGSRKYLGSDGSYVFIGDSSTNIRTMRITIPKDCLPQSGKYYMSYSFMSDIAYSYDSIQFRAYKQTANAAFNYERLTSVEPDHMDNAGQFSRSPVLVDFTNVSYIDIVCVISENVHAVGGVFAMRFQVTNDTQNAVNVGYAQPDVSESTSITAENTTQLVYSQNETNGLLRDIIQHISDQLAAMWDQIAAYLITPWMQQDRELHDDTIDKLDDLDTNVTTTIEEKTEWHANFIIEGLKSLFIPSSNYFQTKISEMQTFFEGKLGFLGYTLTYFIRLLNGIMNASQNSVIRFPGIHAPNRATGEDYVLLPAQDVDLGAQISQISEGNFNLLEFCRTAGDIVLVLSFLVLLQDKLREVEQ